VLMDAVAAGHSFPSGAAQDRRAWTEVVAYAGDTVIYESGVVDEGTPIVSKNDADLWLLRDCLIDPNDKVTHMFWEATSYESHLLPAQVTIDPLDPRYYQTHIFRAFPRAGGLNAVPDRVTLRVRLEPIGFDVLDDLIASGDLAPDVRAKMPTFDMGTVVEWTAAEAKFGYVEGLSPYNCVTKTNMKFGAEKFPASVPNKCKP
jgi:hypothetical protein